MYDHSCRPNCTMVFDGFRTLLRALEPRLDVYDTKKCFISYTDVGRSRYQRRQDLMAKWYFLCQCPRCLDPEDDRLTSIKCVNQNCDQPIDISEDSAPMQVMCQKCHHITEPERIIKAQNFMKCLPGHFYYKPADEETINKYKEMLNEAKEILHSENIYYSRLLMVCYDLGGKAMTTNMHQMLYKNYRRCLPEADRHVGYQLLHLVKSLIEENRREEAVSYAFQAMQIFEVCFGLDHPYYLQTLALWTYLDKHPEKTEEELINLMNFSNNRPINISCYLEAEGPAQAVARVSQK